MKTSVKVIFGVYGAIAGLWLAGSAYFLARSGDEPAGTDAVPAGLALSPEENAYGLFGQLLDLRQTNLDFTVANDYLQGRTNGPLAAAEVDALVAAHSNLYACVDRIITCRGFRPPDGQGRREGVSRLFDHVAMKLLQTKAVREIERGEIDTAHRTLDTLSELGRFIAGTESYVGYLVGTSYRGVAFNTGTRPQFVATADRAWFDHLMAEALDVETNAVALLQRAAAGERLMWQEQLQMLATNEILQTDAMLKTGLSGFAWLMRNHRENGSPAFWNDRPAHIDWTRVRQQCGIALLSCCAGYARYSFKPRKTFAAGCAKLDEFIRKIGTSGYDPDYARQKTEGWRFESLNPCHENWLGQVTALDRSHNSVYAKRFSLLFGMRAGRLRIACLHYRKEHGRLPETLAELVPVFIAEIPVDPYDGEAIRYNAEHGYFWTKGPEGQFDGKVEFDQDGCPHWKNRNYAFVHLIDDLKPKRR